MNPYTNTPQWLTSSVPPTTAQSKHKSSSKSRRRHRVEKQPSKSLLSACDPQAIFASGKQDRLQKIAFRDRLGRQIEIDSDDEYDWNTNAVQEKVWGDREGPKRDRPVDDMLISFRDLFPCLGPILDTCGCTRRRQRRAIKEPQPSAHVPRIEHVCLDCGNVIDAKNVPKSVAIDMFDRGTAERHEAFLYATEQPPKDTFKGYETWSTPQEEQEARYGAIPLPQFDAAPARILNNKPNPTVQYTAPADVPTDVTGHVELPDFPTIEA